MLNAIVSTALLLAAGQPDIVHMKDVAAVCALARKDQAPKASEADWQFKEALCKLPVDARRNLAVLKAVRAGEAIDRLQSNPERVAGAAFDGAAFSNALIQGTADFLVKRGKQELDLWLGEKVKTLCAKDSGVLKTRVETLLPLTCEYLKGDVLPNLQDGGASLKNAARVDLVDLPNVLASLLELECSSAKPTIDCTQIAGWRPLIIFATASANGGSPSEALNELAALCTPPTKCSADTKSLRDATRLVRLLTNKEFTNEWKIAISQNDEKDLIPFVVANALEQLTPAEHEAITDWLDLGTLFDSTAIEETGTLRAKVALAVQRIGGLQAALKALSEAASDTDDEAKRKSLATAAASVLAEIDSTLGAAGVAHDTPLRASIRTTRGLVLGGVAKDFGLVVLSVTQWLDATRVPLNPDAKRIVGFVAAVANANDSDAVTNALEKFAAPVGSSLAKRKTDGMFFTLNAYLGALVTVDTVRNATGTAAADTGRSFSAAGWAPIGFEFGWGGKGTKGSNSCLLHFADLGALTSYRLSGGTTKTAGGGTQTSSSTPLDGAPNVTFKQVFSPGAYFVHGFRNAPVSIAVGASYSPRLRALAAEVNNERPTYIGALRVGLAVAIDIPLFP